MGSFLFNRSAIASRPEFVPIEDYRIVISRTEV